MAKEATGASLRSRATNTKVEVESNNTPLNEIFDNVETNNSKPFNDNVETYNAGLYSIFGTDSYGLSAKIVKYVNELFTAKNINGKAASVNLGGTNFSGVNIQLVMGKETYSQAIVIDERPIKNVKNMLDDDKLAGGGTILFGTALLMDKNKKFIASFDALNVNTVKLDPLVIVAETVKDNMIDSTIKNILKRIEAKPFNSVKQFLDKDKSLDLVANFNTDGQRIAITVNQKDKQQGLAELVVGATGPVLSVGGRVDTTISKKEVYNNGTKESVFALRPVIYVDSYDKTNTVASHNLEYGLMAVAVASIALEKDKYISALMPTTKHKNNIGMLNSNALFPIVKDAAGVAKPIDLLSAKADLNMKITFIDKITTNPSIGIDIEYKVNPTPLAAFATINDMNASNDSRKEAAIMIAEAYKNLTGAELTGTITESVIQYPTGTIIDKNGNEMELKDVDAIWLASLNVDGADELAREWLTSNFNAKTGYISKLDILAKLMVASGLEVKPRGVGYKIILSSEFLTNLLTQANFVVTSPTILEIPNENVGGFNGIGAEIGLAQHISGIGRNPNQFSNNQNVRIIGL